MQPIYIWSERHAEVLHDYLLQLNRNNIQYFILRNYEGLPHENNSKDIDLIICPGKYGVSANLLREVLRKHGVPNYYVIKFERANCFIGIDAERDFYIHIDLIEGYLSKGFEIFTFDELYENTMEYKEYRVLSPAYDAVMLLAYKVIGCSELKEKYREKISQVYKSDANEIAKILHTVFSNRVAGDIVNHLDAKEYEWIVKNAKVLSGDSKKLAFSRRPLYTTGNILAFLIEKFERIVLCPKKMRKMIAVEAPDGTGKTTFIDLLCVRLAECFVADISKMHVYHFRPAYLPNLGELGEKAGVMKQDKDFTNPHRGRKTNGISSLIRILYYWLDYVFGGMIAIRKDVQFDKFSIFDRYAYDFLVDPQRSKINLPFGIRSFFVKTVPHPQITFVLNAEPDIIYSRKQELTLDEIGRQLGEFKRLENIAAGYVRLNANQAPSEVVHQALLTIIDRYTLKV